MAEFFDGKKAATQADYENYIRKLVVSYENKLADQKERIFSLVEENRELAEQVAVFKGKDAQISRALTVAISKAKEIEDSAKLKYDMEIERLKAFHIKWVSYYDDIKNKLPVTDKMLSAEAFLAEMDRILGLKSAAFTEKDDGIAMAQFVEESKRLKEDVPGNGAATVSSGLDMNEVLYPKNLPELEELINQMGILND